MKKNVILMCLLACTLAACGNEKAETAKVESTVAEATLENSTVEQESKETDVVAQNVNLEDYVGYYTNGDYDEVIIEKYGEDYTMEIGLYRLTLIDEGTVSASEEGVVFDAIDAAGDPIQFTFLKAGEDTYTLRVDNSTWAYLHNGDVYENMVKTTYEEAYPAPQSDLEDGSYISNLVVEPGLYAEEYVESIEFEADCFVVNASLRRTEDDAFVEKNSYVICYSGATVFLAGGGDAEPTYMDADGFEAYVKQVMGSGLGLNIVIENGVAKEVGIWS